MNTPLDPELESALREWQKWPIVSEPGVIKQFDAGLNHKTALLKTANRFLVLKSFAAVADKALAAQRWAAEIGISPSIIFESVEANYCLMEYVGVRSLAECTINDRDLQALALSLQAMHCTPADSIAKQTGEFDIFYWCNQYLPAAGSRAMLIHQALRAILNAYAADSTARCFCHNDLVAENCFIKDGRALFIDWEFAQWHNPWFDLASIVYYLHLDAEQSSLFLRAYQPGWEEKMLNTVFFSSQIALLWGDMLWHLAKYSESFWSELAAKMSDLRYLARQLDTELPDLSATN
ncbi:MAG: aminoglycoside phosphotransferase family protein [Pseudomonadota bacterium]